MKWITHIALGFFAVKVTEIALMIDLLDDYLTYIVVSAFAVLPDIDFLIRLRHRTWTHSLYFTAIALVLTPISLKLAFVGWLAIFSHLIGDMMTVSGVKLLYPRSETIFYLVPPRWRIRTGSSVEFMILGVLIIGGMIISSVSVQTETEKLFSLSRDHVVTASFSVFENGARFNFDNVKIVWTDGKDEIGFIENGYLVKISKDQILSTKILGSRPLDKSPKLRYLKVKELKRSIWKNRIVVFYEDDGVKYEFTGTGKELYQKLKKWEDNMIGVWYYEAR